ncbi:RteC domain-containing protein [Phocaeicola coprophilus]|nr:RteC domain-containing protein [Phocaeicola coprophilus]
MRRFAEEILSKIDVEIRLKNCDVNLVMDNALYMVKFIAPMYERLREMVISYSFPSVEDEIYFFKELKPEILSKYIYFSKVYHIELKCPDGSNDCIREYLSAELDKLTYFFRNNIEFYQYVRSQSTHLDNFYFTRKPIGTSTMLSFESCQYDADPLFSTGYDYKAAKILCNKHLKVYLENRIANLNNVEHNIMRSSKCNTMCFTGKKNALIELGYALVSSGDINHGNIEIKEFMEYLSAIFNIDLGDYYDAYIAMKERKDQTSYLNRLIEQLTKRMKEDDIKR